jgi:23S rRNA pseudouridine1911/1915/1917 synthase
MSAEHIFFVLAHEAGMRLDLFLAAHLPGLSRSRLQAVVRSGGVLRNGTAVPRPAEPVRIGDSVTWREPEPEPCATAIPEDIPLEILFEDTSLLVLNKPAGMVVHPGAGNFQGTLVSALLHHCRDLSGIGGVERPGIVHRLDKETSGCLVVAKSDPAHQSLSAQFADRMVKKTYLALVAGTPRHRRGTIDAPITRHRVHRHKMTVCEPGRGRDALTDYRVISSANGTSLIECRPRTGRTHQIRVHLKHLGFPILGDPVYGKRAGFERHMLHAWKLEFHHPLDQRPLAFEAPPPKEFSI